MARTVHSRLSEHGLYTDSPAIRRVVDDSVVAMLAPSDAAELADRLDLGMPLEHALRAVRMAHLQRGLRARTSRSATTRIAAVA